MLSFRHTNQTSKNVADAIFKDLLENGLSVHAQRKYPLATAADQRGEKTINRDAKTAGENVICSISNALETKK